MFRASCAHHQEYLILVRRPLVRVLSLQVSHHISLLGPELNAHSISQMKHQLNATLCRFYFCRVTLHVSGASAHYQEYLKLVQRPMLHVLSLQVSHHFSLLGPELNAHSISQMKHQLDATLCRFYFCRVTLHVSGGKRPSSGVFKTSTTATVTSVIVAGKSSHLLIRAGTQFRP